MSHVKPKDDATPRQHDITVSKGLQGAYAMTHKWEMDVSRTRMDIHVFVWKCRHCGCLQIRSGGVEGKTTYKPNDPAWSPFKVLDEEPRCATLSENGGAVEHEIIDRSGDARTWGRGKKDAAATVHTRPH